MDTVVAKILVGGDENGYMYPNSTIRPDVCPVYKNRIRDVPNLSYKVRKKTADFLATYDHYTIVSERFKNFCEQNKYEGLEFIALPKSQNFYYFTAYSIYKLDPQRFLKFLNYRDCCGSYDEIISPRLCTKKDFYTRKDDFIYRTEFRFGSYSFKNYRFVVGLETMSRLKQAKMKGLYYEDVFQ